MANPARNLAHRILTRIEQEDAFLDRLLQAQLKRQPLSPDDKRLCTQLVHGTLQQEGYLNFLLNQASQRTLKKLPYALKTAMLLGAYELVFLRTAKHAALSESMSLINKQPKSLKGLAHALLQKIALQKEQSTLPDPHKHIACPLQALSVASSHPPELIEEIVQTLGYEEATNWAHHNNTPAPISIRINPTKTSRTDFQTELHNQGIDSQAPDWPPQALILPRKGSIEHFPGFSEGKFSVQDVAAQLVAHAATPDPEQLSKQVIVDLCAAPGGKSTHLAELAGPQATIIAIDNKPQRTELIHKNTQRLGLDQVHPYTVDATSLVALQQVLAQHQAQYADLVVLDAPCTGSGTMRKHPDLRKRFVTRLPRLVALQEQLLDTAAQILKPGGILIYAICSITQAEGPEQIAHFLERHPHYRVQSISDKNFQIYGETSADLMGLDKTYIRTWTHKHHTDGFFITRLENTLAHGKENTSS